MIEKQFVSQKLKEFQIKQFIASKLARTGYSHTGIYRTPLGEKIVIYTTRPGLVVGKKGENINKLTAILKNRFKMENPQIEIGEILNPNLDANLVADRIASTFERFGSKRFKSIGYRALQDMLDAGALGAEVLISGKVPSARARSWRFKAGHLKKSGDISLNWVKRAIASANLKSGTIGIQVSIMTPDVKLPDVIIERPKISIKDVVKEQEKKQEEKQEEPKLRKQAVKEKKEVKKKKIKKENGNNKEK